MEAEPSSTAPRATCRVQLRGGFGLREARARVAYLDALGVSHLYASPLLQARRGSSHGYDVVDPTRLDPELGEERDLASLAEALQARGMGLVVDIVPNHLGVAGADNPYWLDVLEYGRSSPHAGWFDIDWESGWEPLRGKLLLPVLGAPYGEVLASGELVPRFDAESGRLEVTYHEHRFPVAPSGLAALLSEPLPAALSEAARALRRLSNQEGGYRESAEEAKALLVGAVAGCPEARGHLEERVAQLAVRPAGPDGGEALHRLLERQHYRLAWWRTADDRINYRRFFDVNELAALRIEEPEVFDATHRRILAWVAAGWVQGLRVDHVDGLLDPRAYCLRLREACGERPVLLWLEKILEGEERLRDDWPVEGTTGYEFLNLVNGLFVDPRGEGRLDRLDRRLSGRRQDFASIAYQARRDVVDRLFPSELRRLADALAQEAEGRPESRDLSPGLIRDGLRELVACFPVYRSYLDRDGASPEDRETLAHALAEAVRRRGGVDPVVLEWLEQRLLGQGAEGLELALRVQQFTGPVAAKGIEDTALYRHQRLVSLNEVGGDPSRFGLSPAAFHAANAGRRERWPLCLLATSTHDTKRGEDTRARIDVLSELPEEWERRLAVWRRLNARHKLGVGGERAPDGGHELLLYQTLLGSWPADTAPGVLPPAPLRSAYGERVAGWLLKAVREGKQRSSWRLPQPEYEDAARRFVERLLDPDRAGDFLADFLPFQARVAAAGASNGLAQLVLKLGSPGIPDLYQGCELWDLSLADPDNRRPVDWDARARILEATQKAYARDAALDCIREQVARWWDGRLKLLLTWRLLALRRRWPRLFTEGEYLPLRSEGPRAEQVVAFARRRGAEQVVIAAARLSARLPGEGPFPLGEASWGDTAIAAPEACDWTGARSAITGCAIALQAGPEGPSLPLARVFAELPVAVLVPEQSATG